MLKPEAKSESNTMLETDIIHFQIELGGEKNVYEKSVWKCLTISDVCTHPQKILKNFYYTVLKPEAISESNTMLETDIIHFQIELGGKKKFTRKVYESASQDLMSAHTLSKF